MQEEKYPTNKHRTAGIYIYTYFQPHLYNIILTTAKYILRSVLISFDVVIGLRSGKFNVVINRFDCVRNNSV